MDAKSALAKLALARSLALLAFAATTLAPAQALASAQRAPSDSGFGEQWALLNTGQFSGTAGDDVEATRAWEIEPGGNAAVTVGLVDSGVEFAQPSLGHANPYTQGTQASATPGARLYRP